MPERPLRALIVDDERLARDNVRLALQGEGLDVVAECRSVEDAVAAIRERRPDLVFLDIRLPDGDGFDVIRRIGTATMPAVVFVTAHDEFATRAFDVHAVDYVVKPFADDRVRKALRRARARIVQDGGRSLEHRLEALLADVAALHASPDGEPPRGFARRILVRRGKRQWFVPVETVDWFESKGNYVRLHVGTDTHLVRSGLGALEQRLDPACFVRIHRGTIVNVDRIAEIQPWFTGRSVVVLRNGQTLLVSRTYRANILRLSL